MTTATRTRTLAVCGWDPQAYTLVDALARRGGFEPIAITDGSTHTLVRARREAGLPCHRDPVQVLRRDDVAAALVLNGADLPAIVRVAGERELEVFVAADLIAGDALAAALDAARATRARMHLLRPRLRSAGVDFLATLTADQVSWRPHYLELTVEDDAAVDSLLRDATDLAVRLLGGAPSRALAASFDPGLEGGPLAATAELRCDDGRLASIRARFGPNLRIALFGISPRGRFEVTTVGGESRILLGADQADEATTRLQDGHLADLEVDRVTASPAALHDQDPLAELRAATLRSLELALRTGYVTPVEPPDHGLRLLPGGAMGTPGRARLHLVGS